MAQVALSRDRYIGYGGVFLVDKTSGEGHQVALVVTVGTESRLHTCTAGDADVGGYTGDGKQVTSLTIAMRLNWRGAIMDCSPGEISVV